MVYGSSLFSGIEAIEIIMRRNYWALIVMQISLVLAYAIGWPQSVLAWCTGIAAYIGCSFGLMWFGLKLAKHRKSYYLITIAGTSFNWILFGALGSLLSVVINTASFSNSL